MTQGAQTQHFLFICSKNQWRSPTAERIFKHHVGIKTRSAGTSHQAKHCVTLADIVWADIIFVMEYKHKTQLLTKFRPHLQHKSLIVLDIDDEYQYMDEELIDLLTSSLAPFLPSDTAHLELNESLSS